MTEDDDAWRRLLHRWFVQYNPLYLLSATLVLGGTTVLSRAVVTQRIFHGGLAIGAITELYAVMLIVSAAVLVRMRQRRPAVLLALLAVVFECDVTMQVETYAWYGTVGVAASGAWVLLAMGKLWGLSRALRLRASASAWGTIALGASGLAAFPHLLRGVGPSATWTLVAAWLFAVGASALWTRRRVICEDSMDARGRRCVRGTWRLWGGALLAHVAYWSTDVRGFDAVVLIAALGLLSARWMRRERHVWALCAATVVGVALLAPAHLSLIAFLAAATLLLRALRGPARVLEAAPAPSSPYRVASTSDDPTPRVVFVRASQPALHRLCVGAASALYLGAWTAGWSGGPLPDHGLVPDLAFALATALMLWRWRAWLAAAPFAATQLHLAAELGWIRAPRDALELGGAIVGAGFVVLAAGLLASWRLGRALPDALRRDAG